MQCFSVVWCAYVAANMATELNVSESMECVFYFCHGFSGNVKGPFKTGAFQAGPIFLESLGELKKPKC